MQSETQSKPQPDISKRHLLINPSSPTSSNSLPTSSITFPTESTPPSTSPPPPHPSNTKINPTLILVISILAALFFIFLLIHFLLFHSRRRRLHHHHHSSNSLTLPSPRHTYTTTTTTAENSDSNALRRLFRLHDSGLDQSIIDALPVFLYREISACTKKAAAAAGEEEEPFDCAVCLSEFAREDKLRLIPACGHAFHLHCIDTWLMANSTCPLCRSTLVDAVADFYPTGASFDWFGGVEGNVNGDSSSERGGGGGGGGSSSGRRKQPTVMEEVEQGDRRRVYSVRLGKFRCVNLGEEEESSREMEMERISNDIGETGHHSISVDDRRCYSMGSYRYVLGESELLVSLSSSPVADRGGDARGGGGEMSRGGGEGGDLEVEGGGEEGKRISRRSRGESFSVSKIWLWSKKNKCKFDGRTNVDREIGARGVGVGSGLPLTVNYKLDKS